MVNNGGSPVGVQRGAYGVRKEPRDCEGRIVRGLSRGEEEGWWAGVLRSKKPGSYRG